MIEKIIHNTNILAIIIRCDYKSNGIEFFTPNEFSQQLAYMSHSAGHIIDPHIHNKVIREVDYTQEVLFIKSGKIKVDFYNNEQKYLESRMLSKGDVILLATGGHGFEIIDDAEFIEVKQGPYAGDSDKTRFKTGQK